MVVVESLQIAGDNDCTQLPVNPSDFMNTTLASTMLATVDSKEDALKEDAWKARWSYLHIYIYKDFYQHNARMHQ